MRRLLTSVFLGLAALLMGPAAPALAQDTGVVQGVITEEGTETTLPGVNVVLEGTDYGTVTGPDGRYEIEDVPTGTYTVVASFTGYTDAEGEVTVSAGERVTQDLALVQDVQELEEVVVTGVSQGTQTAKLGFSVEKVEGEDINKVPSTDPANALRGRVSGAQIIRPSGEPGSSPNIRLRGTTALQGSQEPLIVVDGAITQGSLEDIDMQNVESIEVIKGVAAASLYGSLAANGVLQVITKQGSGEAGETRVTVRNEFGTNQLANKIPTADHHRRQGSYRPLASESDECDFNPCAPNPLAEDDVMTTC